MEKTMTPHNENKVVKEYRLIKQEYAYNPDILCPDEERVRLLKYVIDKCLNVVDRTIILLYADCQSLRELGKILGVSHATARTEVLRIRETIIKEYNGRTIH